jgi:integrase
MPVTRQRYQAGTLQKVSRAKGPKMWVYRWRELAPDGTRIQRKQTIGSVEKYKTESDALKAVGSLRLQINADVPVTRPDEGWTFAKLWGHFQDHELDSGVTERSPTTIEMYRRYLHSYTLPKWKDVPITEIKAVAVEGWLRTLRGTRGDLLSPGTKMKVRNQMSAIFNHAIRHELYERANPISSVRQGGKRLRKPDVLSLAEIKAILARISSPLIRTAMLVAAVTGLRRSELRGLKWENIDFDGLWIKVERGVVESHITRGKTDESRKGVPMPPGLKDALLAWREQSVHRADTDWVFASDQTSGKNPMWLCMALKTHVRPAVKAARIEKKVGWHTMRHSLATLLAGSGESMKVVQELLRHAQMSTTADLYTQGDEDAKRAAQQKVSSLFLVAS